MQQPILKRHSWTAWNEEAPPQDAEPSEIRRQVAACFMKTALEQDRVLQPLSDDLPLLDSGLDSLCFAIIVAEMEDELGFDPFGELDDAGFPVTFGEFVRLYEVAAERGG